MLFVLFLISISYSEKLECNQIGDLRTEEDYLYFKQGGSAKVYFNFCGGINTKFEGVNTDNIAVAADLSLYGTIVSLGNVDTETIDYNEETKTIEFSYVGDYVHTQQMKSKVVVTCSELDTSSDINGVLENGVYIFSLNKSDFPLLGLIILICIVVFFILFIFIGCIVNMLFFNKKGVEVFSHLIFLTQLPGLVIDGIKFTFCCKKAQPDEVYQPFAEDRGN